MGSDVKKAISAMKEFLNLPPDERMRRRELGVPRATIKTDEDWIREREEAVLAERLACARVVEDMAGMPTGTPESDALMDAVEEILGRDPAYVRKGRGKGYVISSSTIEHSENPVAITLSGCESGEPTYTDKWPTCDKCGQLLDLMSKHECL